MRSWSVGKLVCEKLVCKKKLVCEKKLVYEKLVYERKLSLGGRLIWSARS